MKIKNHRLADYPFTASPNHSGTIHPDTIILHYTAGASAESSISTLCKPDSSASAHVVIGRDGSLTQLVPFNTKAWHAGRSSHQDRSGMNRYSIGIEMDNAGIVTPSGSHYVSWFGRKYPAEETMKAVHRNEDFERYWHVYTEAQINAAYELCEALTKAYPVKYILGHEEVSPGRKSDPGPAFPLDKLRQRLLEKDRSEEEAADTPEAAEVAVDSLNFRESPSAESGKVSKPLRKGMQLKILDKQGSWYKVAVEQQGWVMGTFIDKK